MSLFYETIRFCSIGSPIVGIVLFIYLKVKKNSGMNCLILLMLFSLTCDVLSYVLSKIKISSVLVVNVYFVTQLLIIAMNYVELMPSHARAIKTVAIIFLTATISNLLIQQNFYAIQNLNWAFSTLLVMIIAFIHFVQLTKHPVIDVQRHPPFWISTGILFYGSLSLIILTGSKYVAINYSAADFRLVWIFHNANNIFKNACFAAAIWWSAKNSVQAIYSK
jgi:hypothetical protein